MLNLCPNDLRPFFKETIYSSYFEPISSCLIDECLRIKKAGLIDVDKSSAFQDILALLFLQKFEIREIPAPFLNKLTELMFCLAQTKIKHLQIQSFKLWKILEKSVEPQKVPEWRENLHLLVTYSITNCNRRSILYEMVLDLYLTLALESKGLEKVE